MRETAQALHQAAARLHEAREKLIELRVVVVRARYGRSIPLDRTPLNRMKRAVAECIAADPYSVRKSPIEERRSSAIRQQHQRSRRP